MCRFGDSAPVAGSNTVLTEVEALKRSQIVSNAAYDLFIHLKKHSETYDGECTITFDVKLHEEGDVFLDFIGKDISAIELNGNDISSENPWRSERIHLKREALREQNVLHVVYTNVYDHTGNGFHWFEDPEDKQEYVYTNFEPFECHRLLPCFDQPDIKGRLSLRVRAPADWKVFANSSNAREAQQVGEYLEHSFLPTPPISSYLFALVAGPYDSFYDQYDDGRVPLGIHCRKSLARYLDHEELFTVTKNGFQFYENFFNYRYPFTKYDQIFCPEFNVGAMENVGCVTFTEHYIFRDPPTTSQRANRADTFLHEMAHMWFGNLTTCKWWDGLWLNESFATYMAALAVCEATFFGQLAWQNFNDKMKQWAYREDQLSTTHPVQGVIVDTDATFLNFDGITYGKGASLLKQLVLVVGMDGFKAGMQHYFRKFEWKNTVISDFLEALAYGAAQVGRQDVLHPAEWSRLFLETAGLNSVQPHLHIQDGKISSLVLEQTAPEEYPICRPQHLLLAFFAFDQQEQKPVLQRTFQVKLNADARTEVPELVGMEAPAFLYANYQDHAFIKCLLDPLSEEFARQHVEKFEDPLLRQLIWQTTYNMVRDAKMKSTDFLRMVADKAALETSSKLVATILRQASGTLSNFVPKALYESEADLLFSKSFEKLQQTTQPEWQIVWGNSVVDFARTRQAVASLVMYMEEGQQIGTYTLPQNARWSLLKKIHAFDMDPDNNLLQLEEKRDSSDRGQRAVLSIRSAPPREAVKQAAWARYLDKNTDLSHHMMSADMAGFQWSHQTELLAPFVQPFFDNLRPIFQERSKEFATAYLENLFPFYPEEPSILERSQQILESLNEEELILRRYMKEQLDDLVRAKKCRELVLA
eukprot:TRINITY_DN2849_c0_g1_i1.p1 TRINITY_DN2849_c0_g1~~TRINITY_DN2849_c0_g1_i1.p1  ORF type:complete len:872 (+),score=303.42 TRINITY_DN2849_c0_g1_i1:77-2692(+)